MVPGSEPLAADHEMGRARMKALRLAIATGLVAGLMAIAAPAHANDCSNPKQTCGGCHINWRISSEDPRPVICYI
jgi:nitrate/TMAO reductase-like tetraheme cytochrome c subunit